MHFRKRGLSLFVSLNGFHRAIAVMVVSLSMLAVACAPNDESLEANAPPPQASEPDEPLELPGTLFKVACTDDSTEPVPAGATYWHKDPEALNFGLYDGSLTVSASALLDRFSDGRLEDAGGTVMRWASDPGAFDSVVGFDPKAGAAISEFLLTLVQRVAAEDAEAPIGVAYLLTEWIDAAPTLVLRALIVEDGSGQLSVIGDCETTLLLRDSPEFAGLDPGSAMELAVARPEILADRFDASRAITPWIDLDPFERTLHDEEMPSSLDADLAWIEIRATFPDDWGSLGLDLCTLTELGWNATCWGSQTTTRALAEPLFGRVGRSGTLEVWVWDAATSKPSVQLSEVQLNPDDLAFGSIPPDGVIPRLDIWLPSTISPSSLEDGTAQNATRVEVDPTGATI